MFHCQVKTGGPLVASEDISGTSWLHQTPLCSLSLCCMVWHPVLLLLTGQHSQESENTWACTLVGWMTPSLCVTPEPGMVGSRGWKRLLRECFCATHHPVCLGNERHSSCLCRYGKLTTLVMVSIYRGGLGSQDVFVVCRLRAW